MDLVTLIMPGGLEYSFYNQVLLIQSEYFKGKFLFLFFTISIQAANGLMLMKISLQVLFYTNDLNLLLLINFQNPVGPGRYDVDRYDKAQHNNGHRSAFNSKTKRYDLIRDKYLTLVYYANTFSTLPYFTLMISIHVQCFQLQHDSTNI